MYEIAIFNETNENIKAEAKIIRSVVDKALKAEKVDNGAEVNIIFVNDEKITEINRDYRQIDAPTDVISFALLDEVQGEIKIKEMDIVPLGDIYISVDTAKRQALEYGHSLLRELSFLAVHGLLHLLGYSHDNKENEKVMFNRQEEVLDGSNIKR